MSHFPGAPVVALDIDGTTGRYHEHFHWFAQLYLGRDLPLDWKPEFKGSFHRALHITKNTYREVKLAYRQGGMKRCMPVAFQARELTLALRKRGSEVWVCTTRPYMRLDNIDPDTRHWLDKRARMVYDGVLYGERKYQDLARIVGKENVVAVVDDLPEQVESAAALGLPPLLVAGDHNDWWRGTADHEYDWKDGIRISYSLDHAGSIALKMLKDWKEHHND